MPSAGLRRLVEPIRGNPSPHGLLGPCVEVVDVTDTHELNGTELVPLSCNRARDWTWCPDPSGEKVFERPGLCAFDPVAIYSGYECSPIGQSYDEAVMYAREQLRMGEQRALEEWFMASVLCDLAQGNDLTPAVGPVSVAQGVASLENWLATEYGGSGIVHAPAGAAALMSCCNIVHRDEPGGCLTSLMGNGFVFGAGYGVNVGGAGCTQAEAGTGWLYATPPVRVRREAPQTIPGTDGEAVRILDNTRQVIAERTFVVELACCTAAMIRVQLCP